MCDMWIFEFSEEDSLMFSTLALFHIYILVTLQYKIIDTQHVSFISTAGE